MDDTIIYKIRLITRNSLVMFAVMLVLLSSCPFKSGLKSLIGIPVKKEYASTPKANNTCLNTEIADDKKAENAPLQIFQYLPVAVLFFSFSLPSDNHINYPLLQTARLSGPVPIFIQHRRLLI